MSEPLSTVGHPEVNPYTDTTIPASYARQMMSRMSWGFSAGTWGQLRRAGGAKRWFEEQLEPSLITDPQGAMFDRWYPDRMRTPAEKWDTVFAESKFQWDAVDLTNWSLLRRSRSSRQLLEVMTDFWSNHLHIPAIHDLAWCLRNTTTLCDPEQFDPP